MNLSIIIPVWNGAAYIERALDSIVSQDEVVEVIVVDDGSTDSTRKIVETYSDANNSIRLLENIKEKGVTGARLYGAENAHGEYLFFMDADDTLPPCLSLIKTFIKTYPDTDMFIGDINDVDKGQATFRNYGEDNIHTGHQLFDWIMDNGVGYIWGKAIRKKLFLSMKVVPFSVRFCEDYIQMMQLSYSCKQVIHVGEPIYNYIQNSVSACNNVIPRKEFADRFYQLCYHIKLIIENCLFDDNAITLLKIKFLYYGRLFLWVNGRWGADLLKLRQAYNMFLSDKAVLNNKQFMEKRYKQTKWTAFCPLLWAFFYVPLLKYKYHRIK